MKSEMFMVIGEEVWKFQVINSVSRGRRACSIVYSLISYIYDGGVSMYSL